MLRTTSSSNNEQKSFSEKIAAEIAGTNGHRTQPLHKGRNLEPNALEEKRIKNSLCVPIISDDVNAKIRVSAHSRSSKHGKGG